jgi:transcriptional regulator with XRE-family HTH domain
MQPAAHAYDAQTINEAMEAMGLTNEKLGVKADVAARTVSVIRNGDENVRLQTLKKVAGALKLKVVIRFEPEPDAETAMA